MRASVSLTRIGIINGEAHRSAAYSRTSREDSAFVVTPVVAVQHDPSRLVSDHDDDLVFEQNRQPERISVERPCLGEVLDVEDQALEASCLHERQPNKREETWCRTIPTLSLAVLQLMAEMMRARRLRTPSRASFRQGGESLPVRRCDPTAPSTGSRTAS